MWAPCEQHTLQYLDLDSYRVVEMRIEGPVDHAHSAFTELCFNPVMAKGLAAHSPC